MGDFGASIWGPPLIGAVSGLIGGRGPKQQQQQTQSSDSNTSSENASSMTAEQIREIFENPMFAKAREGLLSRLSNEFSRAERPVYGESQQAKFMSKINDLAASSTEALKQQMAASGAMQSGRFAGGLGNIERAKLSEQVNFFSQLPFMENEARNKRMDGLMGLAANWLGRAPTNERTTSNQNMFNIGTQNTQAVGAGSGSTTGNSQGGWQNALQAGLQGLLGVGAQQGWWQGGNKPNTKPSTGVDNGNY